MAPEAGTARRAVTEAGDYLDRIDRIAPIISEAAAEHEKAGRLALPVLDALHEAGLFRMLLPTRYGGAEVGIPAFAEAIEALARLDGSTAWCVCQANGCAMTAAYVDAAVAEAIWGSDPRGVLAWGPGKGVAVAGGAGYSVAGSWAFASGMWHASWLGGHSVVKDADGTTRLNADGTPMVRTMFFPAQEVEIRPIWDVIGLRATGSDGYAVSALEVPSAFNSGRDIADERQYEAPLYQFPAMALFACGFAATALGLAGAMLDAFMEVATEKVPRLHSTALKDNPVVHAEFGLATARLGAARRFLMSEIEEIWATTLETGKGTISQRMRIRLAATHAIHEARQVADSIYDMAGATAVFASSPFERRYRDLRTVTQQLQGRRSHYATVGAYLFGHPADLSVI